MDKRNVAMGVNPGHGFVKIVLLQDGHEPQHVVMPAWVAQAQQQLAGSIRMVPTVEVEKFGSFWTGEDALISKTPLRALNQERVKDAIFIPALVKGALAKFPRNGQVIEELLPQAQCISGLPATWSMDRELATALRDHLKTVGFDKHIRVIAEPLGLIYAMLFDNDGTIVGDTRFQQGRVAVVDLGHHTIDVAVMQRLVPEPDSLATFQLGTARALHDVQQALSRQFDVDNSTAQDR